MSNTEQKRYNDGAADAVAALTLIAIVVGTVIFWLAGH